MHNNPAIAAAVEIRPGRYPSLSNFDLYREVIAKLLDDCRLAPGDIDGILAPPLEMTTRSPKVFTHEMLAEELGITPRISLTMNAGGASYGYMVQYAALSIAAGGKSRPIGATESRPNGAGGRRGISGFGREGF